MLLRPDGHNVSLPPRWNNDGCKDTAIYNDLDYGGNFDITGFFVRSCTDGNGDNKADSADDCGRSGVVDNPKV